MKKVILAFVIMPILLFNCSTTLPIKIKHESEKEVLQTQLKETRTKLKESIKLLKSLSKENKQLKELVIEIDRRFRNLQAIVKAERDQMNKVGCIRMVSGIAY